MYYNSNISSVEKELVTSNKGLSSHEARIRLKKYGKNILPKKKKPSILRIFLGEFKDPIVFLLLIAIIVSVLANEVVDAIVIAVIVLVDAIMGTYQENRANQTADALDKLVHDETAVIRDGQKVKIPSEELVIGDYVLLESGDKISADLRLVDVQNFQVNESILTGESLQVAKITDPIRKENVPVADQLNMAFSGTTVVSGRAEAVVVKTGLDTELGKIADSLAEAKEEKSPLTIRIEKFSRQISVMVIFIAVAISILMLIKGAEPDTLVLTVIAFAVSALPEGLPLALTMALTIASNRMAKKHVIVRKLKSAESLGSCTVIASDKTGTLTVNEQTAKKIVLPNGASYEIEGTGYDLAGEVTSSTGDDVAKVKPLVLYGALNNEATIAKGKMLGDSIDLAFLVLAKKLKVRTTGIKIVHRIPYESENKYSAVFFEYGGRYFCTVKGSLEVVEEFCGAKTDRTELKKQNIQLAKDGYRVIALAFGEVKPDKADMRGIHNLKFTGMVGFIDPIRKEAEASIHDCHRAGIKVLMITGDHPLTATKIAKDLRLIEDEKAVTSGAELVKVEKRGRKYFDAYIAEKVVFARVTPMQKLAIIESLKRQGEFVAVTGDGVNDAPALKAANIGVAMGSGTDIARETADMIIADDNFKSIVAGVKEGRVAYANIRKIIFFLISCGLAESLFFCLSLVFDMGAPLLAVQLLWLNVVTDGIQDFALSFEQAERDILSEPPRSPEESIFDKTLIRKIIISGCFIGLVVFSVWFQLIHEFQLPEETARGYIMALMTFIQNVHVFNCRSEHQSAFRMSIKSNRMVVFGVAAIIILQMVTSELDFFNAFLHTTKIPFLSVLVLFFCSTSVLIFVELYKVIERKILRDKRRAQREAEATEA